MQNCTDFAPRGHTPVIPAANLNDQDFVELFLRTRKQTIIVDPPATASITTLKQTLSSVVEEIDRLKESKTVLEQAIPFISDAEWQTAVEEQSQVVNAINDKLTFLSDPNLIGELQRKIKARRKKRRWQKRRKVQLQKEKYERLARRKELHQQIDSWQQEQQKILQAERKAQQEVEYASQFLADVHRRKAACKRNLAKFEKLKTARKHRQEYNHQELNQDVIYSELAKLTEIWAAKLVECTKEEKKLKDTLARQSTANAERRVQNEWNRVLFGDAIPRKFDHPLLKADRDLESLIETRRAWDACLVEGDTDAGVSSSIPLGWVLPPEEPTAEWAKYLWKEGA